MGRLKKYKTEQEKIEAQRAWAKEYYHHNKEVINKKTMEKYYESDSFYRAHGKYVKIVKNKDECINNYTSKTKYIPKNLLVVSATKVIEHLNQPLPASSTIGVIPPEELVVPFARLI